MLRKILPSRLKSYFKNEQLRLMRNALPQLGIDLQRFSHYRPHKPDSDCYTLPTKGDGGEPHEKSPFPIPPPAIRIGYGRTPVDYLDTGKEDIEKMRQICAQSGAPLETAGRILELGCAGGRMIRWLNDLAGSCEIWGTDVWATGILWCKQYLSPPFHFFTCTVCPHLPFEDHYFGCIYAGSVFTHIEDQVDAWFLELRRVLRPGGRLFITLIDRKMISIFDKEPSKDQEQLEAYVKRAAPGMEQWERIRKWLDSTPEYHQFKRKEVDMVTLGRGVESYVLWDADFLCKRVEPFFRVLSITERAYGQQTGVLLERV